MIKKESITKLLEEVAIEKVATDMLSLSLKPAGANYKGTSPFTKESTPSFFVSPAKGIFKCFSTGKGGNMITLVMEQKSFTYPQAIKAIAEYANIQLEFDNEAKPKSDEQKKREEEYVEAIQYCNAEFKKLLTPEIKAYLNGRGVTDEDILTWNLGYGGNTPKNLSKTLLKKGLVYAAEELGLVRMHKEQVYDGHSKRITIPIYDYKGACLGVASRDTAKSSKFKYINPKEDPNHFYPKSYTLYGLHLALKSIINSREAYLVEGYFDVISMHRAEFTNTVAACGTSVTLGQLKALKKYADRVTFIFDNDSAGLKATARAVKMAYSVGLEVAVVSVPVKENKADIDDFIQDNISKGHEYICNQLQVNTKEGIVWLGQYLRSNEVKFTKWLTEMDESISAIKDLDLRSDTVINLYSEADKDGRSYIYSLMESYELRTGDKGSALAKLFKHVDNPITISQVVADASKELSTTKAAITEIIKNAQPKKKKIPTGSTSDVYDGADLPEGADAEFYRKWGFCVSNKKYWFYDWNRNTVVEGSNFTIEPHFHIVSENENENKRLMSLNTAIGEQLISMDSAHTVSFNEFKKVMSRKGMFRFRAITKQFHYDQLWDHLNTQFKSAYPLNQLGHQEEGFFALGNGIIKEDGSFNEINELGVIKTHVKYRNVLGQKIDEEKNYYLPAFSHIQKNVREEDDLYENERKLVFIEAECTLKEWMDLFHTAFGAEKSMLGISFLVATFFRDIFLLRLTYFPIMQCYGEKDSGKSAYCSMLQNFVFHNMEPFNLTNGTDAGFGRRLSKTRNTPQFLDENDENIEPKRHQLLKGIWNGVGREVANLNSKNSTTSYKVESSVMIASQHLDTKDDFALTSRSVLNAFSNGSFTNEQREAFSQLEKLKENGVSSLMLDIIKHRDLFLDHGVTKIYEAEDELKAMLKDDFYNNRPLKNYSLLLGVIKVLEDKLYFPFKYEEMKQLCYNGILEVSNVMTSSEAVTQFWIDMEVMTQNSALIHNRDYVIEPINKPLHLRFGRNKRETYMNTHHKEILILKWESCYKRYSDFAKHPIEKNTLRNMLASRTDSYIGPIDNFTFPDNSRKTGLAFKYEVLQRMDPQVHLSTNNWTTDKPMEYDAENSPNQTSLTDDEPF